MTQASLLLFWITSCIGTTIHSFSLLGGPATSFLFPSVVRYGVPVQSVNLLSKQGLLGAVPVRTIPYHFNNVKKRRTSRRAAVSSREDADDRSDKDDPANNISKGIDLNENPALYRVRISRRTGIEWGTDLSFAFVYVRDLEPGGAADLTGKVTKGDQICELRPVMVALDNTDGDLSSVPINLIGATFDTVMTSFAQLDKRVSDVDLVFFRGTKEELIKACQGTSENAVNENDQDITIKVNVREKGNAITTQRIIQTKKGVNIRKVLIDHDINVYQSLTRWTNCKGKQLCGTCIVNIIDGAPNTNRKSLDEISTLRENPEGYRLSCITFAYGDITVETFPPVNAAQWTR